MSETKRWQIESNPAGYWVFDSQRDEDGEPDRTARGFTALADAEAFATAQNASEEHAPCEESDCQECCQHDEFDHDICLDCGYERDPGIAIDRAMDSMDWER